MPLRKFDDKDFDSFVRAKFEAAPPATFDAKAWSKLNAKRGGFKAKLWVAGITIIILIITGLWWWFPIGSYMNGNTKVYKQELSQANKTKTENFSENNPLNSSGNLNAPESKENQSNTEKITLDSENAPSLNSSSNGMESESDNSISGNDKNKNYQLQTVESDIAKRTFTNSHATVTSDDGTKSSSDIQLFVESDNNKNSSTEKNNVAVVITQKPDLDSSRNIAEQAIDPNSLTRKPIKNGNNVAFSNSQNAKNQINFIDNSAGTDESSGTKYILSYIFFKDTAFVYPVSFEPIEQSGSPYNRSDDQNTVIAGNEDKKNLLKDRFILSLLLNTDLSTVKFDEFTNPGFGLGLKISFKVSDRFFVNGGVTKTSRIYDVNDREDYILPPWILDRQGWPEGIRAKCNITEIPIGLRYDLIKGEDWNFYGQLSSSTFLMDREIYDFRLTEAQQQQAGTLDRWEVENRNKHAFNIVGVTVGYEKYFSRRLGVGLEVYWQTTLNGIGIYTVNLNSLGNQIMLNYRF